MCNHQWQANPASMGVELAGMAPAPAPAPPVFAPARRQG
jgi:hypothetical protein